MKRYFYVDLGYACFAIIAKDGIVLETPPIVSWMKGKVLTSLKPWLMKKKAKVMEMMKQNYELNVGSPIIVFLIGKKMNCIVEILKAEPLTVMLSPKEPWNNLTKADFIINPFDTEIWQSTGPDSDTDRALMLFAGQREGRPYISGLPSLGINDGLIHEILAIPSDIIKASHEL